MLQAVLDRLERGERCRIVSTGPLKHLFARAAEHESPPERVAVEQRAEEPTGALAFGPPAAGHAPSGGQCDVGEDGRRHQLVRHAKAECLRGALALAGQNDVERRTETDEPRQALAAAGARENTELYFG